MRRLAVVPLVTALVLPLAACGGGDEGAAGSGQPERLTVLPPIGMDEEIPGIARDLADRTIAAAGLTASEVAVLVAGHGSLKRKASERATTALAGTLESLGRYAEVGTIYLEQPILASDWRAATDRRDVVVVPLFVSGGQHEECDLPGMLGSHDTPLDGTPMADGRRLWLTPSIGRHPALADLIRRRAVVALSNA